MRFRPTEIEEGEAVVAVKEDDSVGGGFKKLLHLPTQSSRLTAGANLKCCQAVSSKRNRAPGELETRSVMQGQRLT
jgi:hypothetical protein